MAAVLPDGSRLIQKDNAPWYNTKFVQEWFEENAKNAKVLP